MIFLGIESTAHTFGVGITNGQKILANERSIYSPKKGIVPAEAAQHHRKNASTVFKRALEKANLNEDDVDCVAVATGPGLPPCLLAGLEFARELKKPLIPVNHCVAHIEIGRFETKAKDPLTIYVSGGNTQIIGLEGGVYRIFGETLDIGIGNAIDKFARSLGLSTPGGPKIEEIAKKGRAYIDLPYSIKGMDLVFSGLVTATEKKMNKVKKEDLVFSFQETIFSMLTEVTERALAHTKKKEVMLTGGVAQNKRLKEMLRIMAKDHNAKFFVASPQYCGDNGAMIAWTGFLSKETKRKIDINARWRTDEVKVSWK